MRYDNLITLHTVTYKDDSIGNQLEVLTNRDIFANKFTISRDEVLNAAKVDLKPAVAFQVHTLDYLGESTFDYNGTRYEVYRTNDAGENVTLYGQEARGNG